MKPPVTFAGLLADKRHYETRLKRARETGSVDVPWLERVCKEIDEKIQHYGEGETKQATLS